MYPDILLALVRAHQRDLLSEAEQAARVRLARAAAAQRRLQATSRAELVHSQTSHRPDVTAVDQRAA
jgi:hypothetical protein